MTWRSLWLLSLPLLPTQSADRAKVAHKNKVLFATWKKHLNLIGGVSFAICLLSPTRRLSARFRRLSVLYIDFYLLQKSSMESFEACLFLIAILRVESKLCVDVVGICFGRFNKFLFDWPMYVRTTRRSHSRRKREIESCLQWFFSLPSWSPSWSWSLFTRLFWLPLSVPSSGNVVVDKYEFTTVAFNKPTNFFMLQSTHTLFSKSAKLTLIFFATR